MEVFEIKTPLDYTLSLTEFSSDSNQNNVVLICSATGVLQGYYSKFASFLSEFGFTVYTFDYSGIGLSKKENLKKFDTTLTNWAINDIESVFKYIQKQHPNKKINCVCHSIGGQLLGLVPSNNILNSIILVTSQNIHHNFWTGIGKIRTFANYHILIPAVTVAFGYLPSKKIMGMENLPKSVALEFASWGRSKNHVFDIKKEKSIFHHQITGNIVSYSTENDNFAPKKAVDWMTAKFYNAKSIRKHLQPKDYGVKNIGHFGFFKSKFKNTIWQEFLSDLQQ